MQRASTTQKKQAGFTLIEVLVVITIIAILFAIASVNLGQPQSDVTVQTTVDTLLSDIKSQQLLAMSGGTGSMSSQQPHGIYIQSGKYTLFAGSTFNGSDSNNFVVNAPANSTISTNLPGDTLLFDAGPGEVDGFMGSSNTITVSGPSTTRTITIDRFGAATVN